MGLDISVYADLTFVATCDDLSEEETDAYHDKYIFAYVHPSFSDQADGLVTGFYKGNEVDEFRAGSYTGYSQFRERLSQVVHNIGSDALWIDCSQYRGKPFVELICFSDCEGIIGPKTSAKLYLDFESFYDNIKVLAKEGPYDRFLEVYESFMHAFKIAGTQNGLVQFH